MSEPAMTETPEESLVRIMAEKKMTIATAESCTGGLISGRLVNAAGASSVFMGGFVTYSNEAKESFIGVSHETLITHGAVSAETAAEMALGCARRAGCDIGLSSTGIAGPGGGTPTKPVGLIYIGCAVKGRVVTRELRLHGSRQENRQETVRQALIFLNEFLRKEQ